MKSYERKIYKFFYKGDNYEYAFSKPEDIDDMADSQRGFINYWKVNEEQDQEQCYYFIKNKHIVGLQIDLEEIMEKAIIKHIEKP